MHTRRQRNHHVPFNGSIERALKVVNLPNFLANPVSSIQRLNRESTERKPVGGWRPSSIMVPFNGSIERALKVG